MDMGVSMAELARCPFCAIPNIRVGHAQDVTAGTGCTVIIGENGLVAGVDVRGGGPATRETDLLAPRNMVERIHAVVLSGGSAYGLEAGSGVMRYLEERQIGLDVGVGLVPLVCGASLFDLVVGDPQRRPDVAMGYAAAQNAFAGTASGAADACGNIGAGTGATVGKLLGPARMMKSGLGSYAVCWQGLYVGAMVAVNALGGVYDAESGARLAGPLSEDGQSILDSGSLLLHLANEQIEQPFTANTTIGCIVTNARLTKAEAQKVASVAHDGYARTIFPVHTQADGDAIFALSAAQADYPADLVASIGARVMALAVNQAVLTAEPAYGLPVARDFCKRD